MLLLETDQSSVRATSRHEMGGGVRLIVRCEEQAASSTDASGQEGAKAKRLTTPPLLYGSMLARRSLSIPLSV